MATETLETASATTAADAFVFGGRTFTSRLIVGTGKYATFPLMREALVASGTEIVTVAVRRVNLTDRSKESLLDYIPKGMTLLPNTAGAETADEAVRVRQGPVNCDGVLWGCFVDALLLDGMRLGRPRLGYFACRSRCLKRDNRGLRAEVGGPGWQLGLTWPVAGLLLTPISPPRARNVESTADLGETNV